MHRILKLHIGKTIVLLTITLLIYLPVLYGLKDAFLDDNGFFTLQYITDTFSRPSIQHSLRFTFIQALLSSIIATILGSTLALSLLLVGFRGARLLRALSIVPFMAPPMVVVTGFTALYGANGLLSSIIPWFRVFGEGFWAIIAAHVFYNIPLSLNFVYASLVSIPREIIDVSTVFSRGNIRILFQRIILPYVLPASASAFTLTFIYCFTSFAIPLSLGGVEYSTLEVYIYYYYKLLFDNHRAAAIALIQYLILFTIVLLFVSMHGKTLAPPTGYRHYRIKLPVWLRRALLVYMVIVFVYLYVPLFAIPYYALLNPYTKEYSLDGFKRVLSLGYDPGLGVETSIVFLNTGYFALMTGVFALAIASIIVFLGEEFYDVVYISLLAISPITLSLGLVRTYSHYLPNPLLIVFAHTIAALPLVTRVLRIGYSRVAKLLVDAAKVLGEHGLPLYMRVIVPLMKPSYLVALSLALVVSLGEFSATLFISTTSTTTLGIAIYRYRGVRDWQASAAAASLLLAATSVILVLLSRKMERWL